LKPETSNTVETGWRTQGKGYQATLTAYLVNFNDRLLGVQKGAGIQGNPTVLSNVGGVKTAGVEAALSLRLSPTVNWFNSISQSNSTYQDDVVSGGTTVATAGKHVVDAPDSIIKSTLGFDDGTIFGNVGVDYMSKRYYTYLNDNEVGARTLLNLSAGYRMKSLGFLRDARLQLGVSNLTDEKYISTVGSNGFGNSDITGTGQTLLTGAPRQVFVTFIAKM
jgi:iron complex outermembrane receptor protein